MITINERHMLVGDDIEEIDYAPTTKTSGTISPKYIMLHAKHDLPALVEEYAQDNGIKESAHLAIDDGGTVTQFAPLNAKTWHAGASYYQGHHGLNGFAIGIIVPARSTESTYGALLDILPLLVDTYNIRDIINIPRPLDAPYDVSEFKHLVEYANADSEGRYISTADVSCYGGPSPHFEIVDHLEVGSGVKVLRRSKDGDWLFILYELRGDRVMKTAWAHESFFRRL